LSKSRLKRTGGNINRQAFCPLEILLQNNFSVSRKTRNEETIEAGFGHLRLNKSGSSGGAERV